MADQKSSGALSGGLSGLRSLASRLGKRAVSRDRKVPWWLLLGVCGVLILAGLALDWTLRGRLRERVADRLLLLHRTQLTSLEGWARDQRELAVTLAGLPRVRQAVQAVTAPGLQPMERVIAGAPLAEALAPVLESLRRKGWVVLDRAGVGLVFEQRMRFADVPLHQFPGATDALEGRVVVHPPARLPEAAVADGLDREHADVWVWAPVRAAGGTSVFAVLGQRMDPARDFEALLNGAEVGQGSTETYAFDASGTMLTRSRFDATLVELGLLDEGQHSSLNVSIRDPGGDMTRGHEPRLPRDRQPLTRMAMEATQGHDGSDLDGYRDYRGVEVVGVWSWLDDLQIGVATEMDADEAYDLVWPLRLGLWLVWLVLTGAAVAAFFFSSRARLLAEEVESATELGQYKLGEKLGEGGMGMVFRATHAMLARPTAIKVLRGDLAGEEVLARFEREVRATAELAHPNTIAVYDFGRTPEGTFYYAMELLDGVDLETLISSHGPQPTARVLDILAQVLGSLAEAHAHGMVHRDIKPANIMLTRRGGIDDFVKVLDFGLVRTAAQNETKITQANQMLGTPLYMAPEAMTAPDQVDGRIDIYAVGAVAYFLLTGEDAFAGNSSTEVISKHLSGSFVRLDQRTQPPPAGPLPGEVVELVHRCLARDPNTRPGSARELLAEVEVLRARFPWSRAEASAWWEAFESEREADSAQRTRMSNAPTMLG